MRIHSLQHIPFEDPAHIFVWAEKNGHRVTSTRLFDGDTFPDLSAIDFLIVMGGPMGVHDEKTYPWLVEEKRFIQKAAAKDKKILGICLGAQLLADILGAKVYPLQNKEIGWFPIQLDGGVLNLNIFQHFPDHLNVFHWHGDTFDIPGHARPIASSKACIHQGFIYRENVIALQFHIEATLHSMNNLVSHCRKDLVPGPFVQSPDVMRKHAQNDIPETNRLLESLLDKWIL